MKAIDWPANRRNMQRWLEAFRAGSWHVYNVFYLSIATAYDRVIDI